MVEVRSSETTTSASSNDEGLSVIAVVLTYRRPEGASQVVLDLIENEKLDPRQVVLVVNGDGGLDQAPLEARIRVHRLAENLGPAGGFARGLEYVRRTSAASWIYLCEDDQGRHQLPACRLRGLVDAVEHYEQQVQGPPVGVVLASGRRIDMRSGRTYRHEFRRSEARFGNVDYGPFWGALLSRRVVDENILPDEAMFWWAEDLDFWLRVRRAGFRVLVDAVAHKAARNKASSSEPWCGYYMARNNFYLQRRYGGFRWGLWHVLKSGRRLQHAPSNAHRIAIVRGLLDGILGRTGKNPNFSR